MLRYKSTMSGMILCFCASIFARCERQTNITEVDKRLSDAELSQSVKVEDKHILHFGFDMHASLEDDAKQYIPFMTCLEQHGGGVEIEMAAGKGTTVIFWLPQKVFAEDVVV